MLWRALGQAVDGAGFYIDVGASDPTVLSVTRAFYERGWRGLNIEPLPEAAVRLEAARPRDVTVAAAAAESPGRRRFHRVFQAAQTGLSTFDADEARRHAEAGAEVSELDVPVTTLAALCREHVRGPVHFLKIDAEGAESEVLAGADFAVVRPWIVLLEAARPDGVDGGAEWEPLLTAAGYRFVYFDGLNRFYLAAEHESLARHFERPPNVFDHYQQYDPMLQEHVVAVEALVQARGERIEALEAELAQAQAALAAREREAEPKPPEPEPEPEPLPPPPEPACELPVPAPEPVRPQSWKRRVALSAYRLVRPVARPVAWRLRGFMTGDMARELAWLREQQDAILQRIDAFPVAQSAALAAAQPAGPAGAVSSHALERALLTMALEDASNPAPCGLLAAEPEASRAAELPAASELQRDVSPKRP